MSPKGFYKRTPEQIQKLSEQMTRIGKGRKGKKYASTEPHEQPMEEVTPKPAESQPEPIEPTPPQEPVKEPEPTPTPEPAIHPPTPPTRPLTGPEIRRQQEESGK